MKRILMIALCLLLLLPAVVSCSSGTSNAEEDTAATGTTPEASGEAGTEVSAEEERVKPDIPEKGDYGGDEIYFLVWENQAWADTVRQYRDIYAETTHWLMLMH